MELTQLTFAVDTTPLDIADKKIRGLGEALKTLERPMSAIAKDSSTVASGVEEVASKAQAAGSKLKGVEASLEKVSTAMKIFRGETVEVGNEVVNLGSSFTKSQANFLALQKQLGASADQLKSFAKEFNDFNKITSANTFDNSIAGVQRLTKDIRELSEVNKLAAANTTLTRDQVMNLVRDTERLQQAMQSMGKSNDEINASIAQQTQQYVNLANEKNKLIAQTKAMEDSARAAASAELERAKASAYVTKEAEKLAFVNAQLKEGFTVSSANALYKYKEALDLTGVSADQAKTKLAAFGEQLKSKQSSSPFAALVKDAEETRKQVNHLARDVSVQLGDIAISLAGGQNPFMVMIQQGDQIRGALMRAKDSGVDSSNAIRNALDMMVTSFVDVGKMAGTFFVGSIKSAGNAVKRLVAEKTFLGAAIDSVKTKLAMQGEASSSAVAAINKLGAAFTVVAGTAVVGFIASLGAMVVAYAQVVGEQDKLVKTINLVGGSLGLTADQVNMLAQTYAGATGTITEFTNAIVEIAKTNAIPEDMIQRVSSVAIELEKVADIPVEKTIAEFAKLGEKPTEAAIKLAEATGLIDAETLKTVASLERQGNTAEAAKLAIEGYAKGLSGATEIIRSEVSTWETISNAFFESFKRGWDAVKSLFRQAPLEARLAEAQAALESKKSEVDNPSFFNIRMKAARVEEVQAAQEIVDSLNKQIAAQKAVSDGRVKNSETAEFVKNTEAAINATLSQRDKLLKQISIEQKKIEDGKIEEAAGLNLIKKLRKDIADIDEKESKKSKGPKPKETFSIATDNTIAETKKSLDTQLKLVKEFENNRRDALKNAYESGLISRGEYLAQETAMTIDAFESQQQVIDKYQQYLDSFNQRRINVIKSYDDAVAKGGNKQELAKQLSNELANLDRAANGASETLDAMRASLSAATDKRFTESWKESNKALMESKKAYEEFESTVNNANQERQSEIQLQIQLSSAHGAEAEAIKASTAAMKSYAPAINKMALELRKAQQEYDNFMRSIDYSDDSKFEAQMLDADRLQKNLAQQRTNYNNAVAKARQDAEQAATDASTLYQINKYNELKGTLSDSIYTAIFEGGKKGGDALKNYLMKEFKNFAIKVFIEPIVGSIMGGFTGGSGVSGVAGSGGSGGATSIISTAANLYKGGLSFLSGEAMKTAATQAVSELGTRIGEEIGANLVMDSEFFGNIAGAVGNAFAGYGISKAIGNGYKTGLGNAVDIAGAIGSYFFGPVAGVVSGIVNRAFGRKLKDTGIEGTFSNTGFEGQNYQFYKGGWLRSDKTTYSEMDQTMENLLSYQFKQLQLGTAALATSIGAGVDSIKDFTKKIKVSFKDLDEKQINEKLTEVYTEISNEMAAGVLRSLVKSSEPAKFEGLNIQENILGIEFTKLAQVEAAVAVWNKSIETGFDAAGNKLSEGWIRKLGDAVNQANDILDSQTEKLIESYQWFGETFSETLKRLSSSITTVNESFRDLGYTLIDVSLQGASKASDIISLFGGEDQYVQATGYFYENAYSQEEKAANLTNRLSEALGRVNEKLPDSISGYRDLVDAYAKQGDAGREVWASLVQLFPAFEQLNNLNEEIANSFNDLLGNYYEKFGTETERVAFQTGLLQKSLAEVGIELPKTREEYVLQVKAYQNLGDAGKEVLTVLLENADAFDTLYPAVKDSTEVIKSVTDYYNELKNAVKSNEDIARERISLEERLFNATATTAEIAEKARNAIDPMNRELYDTVVAAETLKDAMAQAKVAMDDVNSQIADLESDAGPLDAIKTGIQAYITKFRELGQLTPEVEASLSKLLNLQLAPARDELYSRLLTPAEAAVKAADKLASSFAELGFEMPKSTQALRDLIDGVSNQETRDSLLQLVPAFVSVQGAAAQVAETIEQAYNRLKNVTRTNEDIAREKISLEERLFNATATAAQIAEKARNAIDPLNLALYDQVIAAESAKALLETQKQAAGEKLQADIRLAQAQNNITEVEKLQKQAFVAGLVDLTEAQKTAKIEAYDYAKAIDKQIEAFNKTKEIEQERVGLQDRLNQLEKTTVELRAIELSKLDVSNQELQKRIWAIEDEAKALAFAKEIAKTKTDADIRLLEAQGNIAEAERLQREQFINGLSDLTEVQKQAEIGAYDYAKAIDKQIATLQEHTGLENRLYQLLGNTAILRERELAALDPSNRALQQRIWAIEDAESALGKAKSATDEAMSKVREIADSQITELEKQATATDRVYESLSNAVEKQKESLNKELERATEQSQNLKDIFDTLTQSIKDLRSEAESTKQIGIDEARSLIRTATVTGVLPEKDKLSEAVGVLNAGVTEGVYSTKVEQQKAILLLSNDLEALKNVTEPQLTTAEATVKSLENQIKQLDDLLQSSKEQIDIARGTNAEVMTVADAQSKLQSAIAAEKQSLSQIAEIKRQVRLAEQQYNALNNINTGVKTLVDAIASLSKAMADQKLAQGLLDQAKSPSIDGQPAPANSVITSPTLTNEVLTEAQIKAGYRKMYEGIDVDKARLEQNLVDKAYKAVNQADSIGGAAARAAWESGANNADAMKARDDAIAGFLTSQGYASDLFSKQHKAIFNSTNDPMAGVKAIAESIGVSDNWLKFSQASFPTTPAFADGGYYPGGLALVGEEGPELINFNNPGMVYTAAQSANLMKGDNSDLAEELRALRQEVQMLRAEARATAINTSKTARILDDVSQGGDSLKTTTA